jgi:hypothetical protein
MLGQARISAPLFIPGALFFTARNSRKIGR